ncbi:hypothetical protein [Paludibacterium yongneupense]|uniref:hypothetical protein n=1 Tax=Paludibacterium yongneupense TaxID=400061 RepID=UPI0004162FC8|nr:hypothetical protein [Paludibacterium yongneupense]
MIIPAWVKPAAAAVLLALSFAAGWVVRGWRAEAVDSKAVAGQAAARTTLVQHQAAVTARVDASGAAREQQTQIVYRTIHDQVIRYVEQKDGSSAAGECVLDAEWVRLHDDAAVGRVSDASGAGHDTGAQAGGDR